MIRKDFFPRARINPDFLKNLDSWLTDGEIEKSFFTPHKKKNPWQRRR